MSTGAETILELAARAGVTTCFANPGTTEVSLVAALEGRSDIRPVLGLFEGVCTGAADGFARVADAPALVLLHLGPGLANGMANLHNARRAGTGVLTIVGDHPEDHLVHDSPVTSDILGMATTVSDWARATASESLVADVTEGLSLARAGKVATLVVPMDVQAEDRSSPASTSTATPTTPEEPGPDQVQRAAEALREDHTVLLLGGSALRREGLLLAHRLQSHTGCRVFTQNFPARFDRGRGIPTFKALPYFPEAAVAALAETRTLVAVGTAPPVGNFAVPGVPGRQTPETATVVDLGHLDAEAVLRALVEHLEAPEVAVTRSEIPAVDEDDRPITPKSIGALLAACLPDGAVVVDEGATSSYGYVRAAAGAAPHPSLGLTGGAIGIGLPMAVGAAIASGGRVVALQADGSGMYTNQALWTMAREALDVTVVILANHRYAILQTEMQRAGTEQVGPVAHSLTDLHEPTLDWVSLGRSMGVPGERCTTNAEAAGALRRSLAQPGPSLIQVEL